MRILWLKTELLHPVDKGGRIRTYQMLRALAREHDITYLTLDDGTAAPDALARASEYAHKVVRIPFRAPVRGTAAFAADLARNLFSPLPYAVAKYRSAAFTTELARLAAGVDLVVCDFLFPAVNIMGRLPGPTILFQHNVEAEIWRRHAEVATRLITRQYLTLQWRRMTRFERQACARFDFVAAVSEFDAAHFRSHYGVPDVAAIPTGVDTEFFAPGGFGPRESQELVFTGSMDWMPNEEGISYFLREVLPLIRRSEPAVHLTIVGRSPSARLERLAENVGGVTLTGRVADVRPYLARATATVVPLRIGGGTRLKIYEAMAMECPVVSTTIGAEGLPLLDGEHLILADTPETMAARCLELLSDPVAADRLGRRAADYVRQRFDWAGVASDFAAICDRAVARHRAADRRLAP